LKQDFGLDAFCLQDFWATEASFRFIVAAYNLMSLFRHFGLNSHTKPPCPHCDPIALQ
jgi:hypothetical protein